MGGKNSGTGWPHDLRCSACKRSTNNWKQPSRVGFNLEATGHVRNWSARGRVALGARGMGYQVEYRCRDCGHIGWTRHIDARRLLKRLGLNPPARNANEHEIKTWVAGVRRHMSREHEFYGGPQASG
jgi:hypothetical protein